jgi:hypothetical protein
MTLVGEPCLDSRLGERELAVRNQPAGCGNPEATGTLRYAHAEVITKGPREVDTMGANQLREVSDGRPAARIVESVPRPREPGRGGRGPSAFQAAPDLSPDFGLKSVKVE